METKKAFVFVRLASALEQDGYTVRMTIENSQYQLIVESADARRFYIESKHGAYSMITVLSSDDDTELSATGVDDGMVSTSVYKFKLTKYEYKLIKRIHEMYRKYKRNLYL